MTPDEPNIERDPLLRALSELPREDLDAWRSERLRLRAHAELSRARAPLARAGGAIELLLMAASGLLAIGRLAMVVSLIMGQ